MDAWGEGAQREGARACGERGACSSVRACSLPQTMSPRQLQLMAKASISGTRDEEVVAIGKTVAGTLKEIPLKYLTQRLGVTKDAEEL